MRKHPCFSKLKKGDIVTDNVGEEFEVVEIDKEARKAKLKDLQDLNSKFWVSAIYINNPQLLDGLGECIWEVE